MSLITPQFILATLCPPLLTGVLYLIQQTPKFQSLSYKTQQILFGIPFGILAILSTEFSINFSGGAMNVRDAAPLVAGLFFGAPAGIIAGLIGGIERYFAVYWGVGEYTQIACTLGTIAAGFIGATVRKFMLDNKKPSWFYALSVGITAEVFHLLLVFLTHMDDITGAFMIVRKLAIPMIAANGISVMLASVVVKFLMKVKSIEPAVTSKNIAQTFQTWLLICILIALSITSHFTFALQNQIASTNADDLLIKNMEDIRNEVNEASDNHLLQLTKTVAKDVTLSTSTEELHQLTAQYQVSEINLVNDDGIIINSTVPAFIDYDMATGHQSAAFLPLLNGTKALVQRYQPTTLDPTALRKYAGVALPEGGFVQVGYDASLFQTQIRQQVMDCTKNRHIGHDGYIIICDENWNVVRGRSGESTIQLDPINTDLIPENTRYIDIIYGEPSYCVYTIAEGYYLMTVIPQSEVNLSRDLSVFILVFMEIIVFAILFALIYYLIKHMVVDNIREINRSLAKITGGNLDVVVDVRSNEEFASLSDDINSTVLTLKHYINEAGARIDAELEFAKSIQHNALPSVFPPFPHRNDFEIFASMDTAKEVGGDFYDFYLLKDDLIAFLMADVSGKGIPAAMFMMKAKTLIKDFAESGMDVADAFTKANASLCEGNKAGMFVTAWMGYLDLKTGVLSFANAGHNPPVICKKNGEFEYLKSRPNFILAGMEGMRYKKNVLQLNPGDQIYLYTDGVTEAQNVAEELYSEERLLNVLNQHRTEDVTSICKAVRADVDVFAGEADQFDDITMIGFKLNYLKDGGLLTVYPDKPSIAYVTDFLDGQLDKLDIPMKIANKLKIAADEIYSNIVYYSGATSASVYCNVSKITLSLIFRDNGTPYNPLESDDPDVTASLEERQIGGLGIFMVKNMMDSVEYEYQDGWNVLTMKLNI